MNAGKVRSFDYIEVFMTQVSTSYTPLKTAYESLNNNYSRSKLVSAILSTHTNVNFRYKNEGRTLLSLLTSISNNDDMYELIEMVLQRPDIDVNLQDKDGESPLSLAVRKTKRLSERAVEMLLQHPDIDINIKNNEGFTPLMFAVRNSGSCSTERTVEMLLARDDIDINATNNEGIYPLIFACANSNSGSTERTVRMLLERDDIDVNKKDNSGWFPLIYSATSYNTDSTKGTTKLLLEYPDIDVNLQDNEGQTSLMACCAEGEIPIKLFKMFLEHKDIDLNVRFQFNMRTQSRPNLLEKIMEVTTHECLKYLKILIFHPKFNYEEILNNQLIRNILDLTLISTYDYKIIMNLLLGRPETYGDYLTNEIFQYEGKNICNYGILLQMYQLMISSILSNPNIPERSPKELKKIVHILLGRPRWIKRKDIIFQRLIMRNENGLGM
jgi:ankyrin repeat protein